MSVENVTTQMLLGMVYGSSVQAVVKSMKDKVLWQARQLPAGYCLMRIRV
ncbi:MAG: hypothetical protein HKP62_01945 [Sulfurovum sp.]|nr:hypothetical protein [Sulfurovum sp.]MBT8348193.1 hypothetical protein [Sulfurovum sp.]NNJ44754.1 hypothetical protein [Sulfurovum sp.]